MKRFFYVALAIGFSAVLGYNLWDAPHAAVDVVDAVTGSPRVAEAAQVVLSGLPDH